MIPVQRTVSTTTFAIATVGDDGSLHLNPPSTSLKPGETVLVTICPVSKNENGVEALLRGSVIRYDDPFGPAAPSDDWEALQGC